MDKPQEPMISESQSPVTKELWYTGQKAHADNLKEVRQDFTEFKGEMKEQLDRMEGKLDFTNGKVRGLQVWKGFITGGLTILALIVVPILLFLITQNLTKPAEAENVIIK